MNRIRPLAGAVLLSLLLFPASAALADRVDVIVPGGESSLLPPGGEPEPSRDPVPLPDTTPRTAAGSDSGGSGESDSSPQVDSQPTLQTRHFGGQISLSCEVASARDLVVVNHSPEPLPPGTRIKWQLKSEGKRGFFSIIGELGGGKSLVADGVLDGSAARDEICVARVI